MHSTSSTRKNLARWLLRVVADRSLPRREMRQPLHIVVPRWDAKLGDAIVSSFFFREARKLGARVTVLTVAELVDLHRIDLGVERVITIEAKPSLRRLVALARELGPVDALVHLVERIQPAELLFIRLLQPIRVYSLDDPLRCVNRKLGSATAQLPVAERFARVLADLGACGIDRHYVVPLPKRPVDDGSVRVLFNPYASRADKSLGFDRALALARALADAWPDVAIGILCSPQTRTEAARLADAVACCRVRAMIELDTPQLVAGAIRQALAVVSVDTAIVHMAVGLQVPLVAIYPLTGDAFNPWLPPGSPLVRVVFSRQDPGHYQRSGRKDMNAFSDAEVLGSLAAIMPQVTITPAPRSLPTNNHGPSRYAGTTGPAGSRHRETPPLTAPSPPCA